jgi:acid stress-induced BolA-like protein IbaG/YrbA
MNLNEKIHHTLKSTFWDDVVINFFDERWDGKHFFLDISSEKFRNLNRVDQSKLVYACLDIYMQTWYIHALKMKCRIPENNNT